MSSSLVTKSTTLADENQPAHLHRVDDVRLLQTTVGPEVRHGYNQLVHFGHGEVAHYHVVQNGSRMYSTDTGFTQAPVQRHTLRQSPNDVFLGTCTDSYLLQASPKMVPNTPPPSCALGPMPNPSHSSRTEDVETNAVFYGVPNHNESKSMWEFNNLSFARPSVTHDMIYPRKDIIEDLSNELVKAAPRRILHRVLDIDECTEIDYKFAEYNSSLLYLNLNLKGTPAYYQLPFLMNANKVVLFLPKGTPLPKIHKDSSTELLLLPNDATNPEKRNISEQRFGLGEIPLHTFQPKSYSKDSGNIKHICVPTYLTSSSKLETGKDELKPISRLQSQFSSLTISNLEKIHKQEAHSEILFNSTECEKTATPNISKKTNGCFKCCNTEPNACTFDINDTFPTFRTTPSWDLPKFY